MTKILLQGLLIALSLYGIYLYQARYTFSYEYLDSQKLRHLDESDFVRNKNELLDRIKSFENRPIDQYTANFRQLTQARRCRTFLDFSDSEGSPVRNHREFYKNHSINDYPHAKNFNETQKSVANDYLELCLNLLNDNETYQEMNVRLTSALNSVPQTPEGLELKEFNQLTKQLFKEQQFDLEQMKNAQLKINSNRVSTYNKNKYRQLLSQSKKNLDKIAKKYHNRFLNLLNVGLSPDVKHLIISNYHEYLPSSWKDDLIQSLSGISSAELSQNINNHYFAQLIHPSKDLYLCTIGYPCDEKSYLMYFQCLGLKYSANKEACNQPVYSYYFSDFLTQNMQYDAIKVINYMRGSGK